MYETYLRLFLWVIEVTIKRSKLVSRYTSHLVKFSLPDIHHYFDAVEDVLVWNGIYLPPANEVWGKVIFSEACVKNSVHRGMGTWAGTPPWQVHPSPWQVHPAWAGTPTWAGTPPWQVPTPRVSVCWEIRATSGRYTSYWNVFLLTFKWHILKINS